MKYLIGVDGSDGSFEAVRFVSRIVDPMRDEVALYYRPINVSIRASTSAILGIHQGLRQSLAEKVFAEARKLLPPTLQHSAPSIIGAQSTTQGLIVAADEWQAELIVVGARGLGPIQRLLLGSVSRKVVQAATIPVLVVRSSVASSAAPLRLLVAYDRLSEARQQEILAKVHWPHDTAGHVMRVVEPMFAGPLPAWLEQRAREADVEAMAQAWIREHDEEVRDTRDELGSYISRLPAPFQGYAPIVVEGHPGDQILKAIDALQINLAIVGKSAGGPWKRMLLGSTAFTVLNHAPCSILIVPGAD